MDSTTVNNNNHDITHLSQNLKSNLLYNINYELKHLHNLILQISSYP